MSTGVSRNWLRTISGLLCALAWLAELAYLISLRVEAQSASSIGVDFSDGLAWPASLWFAAAVLGLCMAMATLLDRGPLRWEWFVAVSACLFFAAWLWTDHWALGLVETYSMKWAVAQRLHLLTGFIVRDLVMPGFLLTATTLAVWHAVLAARDRTRLTNR